MNRLNKALEELNKEYIMLEESKEYKIGKRFLEVLNYIRRLNIVAIIKMFSQRRKNKIKNKKLKV